MSEIKAQPQESHKTINAEVDIPRYYKAFEGGIDMSENISGKRGISDHLAWVLGMLWYAAPILIISYG